MHFKSLRIFICNIYIYTIYIAIISLVLWTMYSKHIELYVQYNFNTIRHILTIYQNQISSLMVL